MKINWLGLKEDIRTKWEQKEIKAVQKRGFFCFSCEKRDILLFVVVKNYPKNLKSTASAAFKMKSIQNKDDLN